MNAINTDHLHVQFVMFRFLKQIPHCLYFINSIQCAHKSSKLERFI